MSTTAKVILGIVGATAVGVAVGLLLAPEKGADLRARISQKAGDWGGQLSDLFSSAKDEVGNLARKGARAAADAGTKSYT
jgi:gas vesicle protein